MTVLEKIADWLSGGKLTLYKEHRDHCVRRMYELEDEVIRLEGAIIHINEYVSPQKSGTAQKVARMCEEALKNE